MDVVVAANRSRDYVTIGEAAVTPSKNWERYVIYVNEGCMWRM